MSQSKWILGFAVAALLVAPAKFSAAYASDEIRIGTVDMQKALQSVDAGKKAKQQLEREFNARKKELQAEEESLHKATDEFKKQSLALSDEARAKKQNEIQERIMKYQDQMQKSQMEIHQKEQELTEPILDKLRVIIGEMAKQKGYTVVLERNENMVLFSQDKDDLTTDVIAVYNKKNSG